MNNELENVAVENEVEETPTETVEVSFENENGEVLKTETMSVEDASKKFGDKIDPKLIVAGTAIAVVVVGGVIAFVKPVRNFFKKLGNGVVSGWKAFVGAFKKDKTESKDSKTEEDKTKVESK